MAKKSRKTREQTEDSERRQLLECQKAIGYKFRDGQLLRRCLTHASTVRSRLESNERLEFLGDAILSLVVCEHLYRTYPDWSEGELTRVKSVAVSRRTCARVSREMGLDRFLLLAKGVATGRHVPSSILAAVYESLIGGIYLDGGMKPARRFIEQTLIPHLEKIVSSQFGQNYKSLLQELTQREFGEAPTYHVLDEQGPDHSKCFLVAVSVGGRRFPGAWGPSKKAAEQAAAKIAYEQLQRNAKDATT